MPPSVEEPFARTAELTEEQFDRSLSLNRKSVWLCLRQEIRQMLAQDAPGGAIVNTSSINGLGGTHAASFYAAAKAAVIALSKSTAREYTLLGIRVNALVAGAFDTPMPQSALDRGSAGKPEVRAAVEARWREMVPVGRIGHPEEAAEAIVWLCSDAASYVTGHSMIVDRGLTSVYR